MTHNDTVENDAQSVFCKSTDKILLIKNLVLRMLTLGAIVAMLPLLVDAKTPMVTQDCLACHQSQTEKWQQSDHYMAMALPSSDKVLGNFNQQSASHYNQHALFFTRDNQYMVTIFDNGEFDTNIRHEKEIHSDLKQADVSQKNSKQGSEKNEGETFVVKYTFGHYPLQQYLVETENGRLQVIPFAWDSRPKEQGGQRWYHNYNDEAIQANDRLHWRQPLQNWNGMCADCHSDELTRNYNMATNTFNTQFSGINVGCVSCHGNMQGHTIDGEYVDDNSSKVSISPNHPLGAKTSDKLNGHWQLMANTNTAVWKGDERDNAFMDTCYACHSLRAPLTDGFIADKPFLDQFSPSLVVDPLYYADGQIKEEVYVYGSFLQSKMHSKGVNCLDCHDPHTMKLKIEGNGLCLQCHKATEFNTPSHHKHQQSTGGAQCVNCHMPDKIYMGVDNRRDHSFKIPRPDLSNNFDTPNACVACHSDESNAWAAAQLLAWNGEPQALSINQKNLLKLRHGQIIDVQSHLNIVKDTAIDTISRASALEMLQRISQGIPAQQLIEFVSHEEPLIRLAAARASESVEPQSRVKLIFPLLQDQYRAIRVAGAQALIGLSLTRQELPAFSAAFVELNDSNILSAWRGEGRINVGSNALQNNDIIGAELAFKAGVDIDPYFAPSYVNLADLYRAKQREDLVEQVLTRGLDNNPSSADISYSYGLHLVRTKKLTAAISIFKRSMQLDRQNPQYAYTYVLGLDGNNQSALALKELKVLIGQYADTSSLKELGLYLAQKNNNRADFDYFQRY